MDAMAYRCLCQYKTLLLILSKLDGKNYNEEVVEYINLTENEETQKQLREKHRAKIEWVKKSIDDYVEKNKAVLHIKETLKNYNHAYENVV